MSARFVSVVGLLLVGCVFGNGSPGKGDPFGPGLWPLTTGDRRPWAGTLERQWLGPLIHQEAHLREGSIEERRLEVRPLYSWRATERETEHDLLFPLARRRRKPDRDGSWLFWLARSRDNAETQEREWMSGPVYRGRTDDGRGYSGFFPLLGKFKETFGLEHMRFILWPLYARGQEGEYTETQILWPFFAYGQGGGRFKLRIWPLFGVVRRPNEVRRFFLWPFIHHHRSEGLVSSRSFFVIPLYGRRDTGAAHTRFYLFPLYSRQWHDSNPNVHSLELLWPLFTHTRNRQGEARWALRPLVDIVRGPERRAWSVGLGLLGRSRTESEGFWEEELRILWTGRIGQRHEESFHSRRVELWPLLRFSDRRGRDGNEGFLRFPSLLPLHGLDPDGWDRHYNKLFELYGSRWRGDERRSSLLFGLREVRQSPTERWSSWAGLLHLRY
ncbi:MAG: hypothetical protein V3T14_11390 [Myxococcota bacterium]